MYFCNVNSRHSSCPIINNEYYKKNHTLNRLHPTHPILEYDDITYSERYITQRIKENDTKRTRNLITTSSEELEALLGGTSVASLRRHETPDFTDYWHHQLYDKVIQNYNMYYPKHRNKGCLCKPIQKKEDVVVGSPQIHQIREVIETKGEAATRKSKTDEEQANKVVQQVSSVEASDKMKVCLPLDLEKLGKDSSAKTIKLIIYGDKTQCDCKGCNFSGKSGDKDSSSECLACNIARSPQIRNLYTGWSDEKNDKDNKTQRKGFPSRFSGALSSKLSFFKKKPKPPLPTCVCADKCAQTCKALTVDKTKAPSTLNKACSCMCCSKSEGETNTGRLQQMASTTEDSCKCPKCGKIDVEKLSALNPCFYQNDCLKWVLKMEAKQNYRQIKSILKELKEQRQEIIDLHKRCTSLMKFHVSRGSGSDDSVEKYRQIMKLHDRSKTPEETVWMDKSKDLKNAINRSTLSREISSEDSNVASEQIEKPPSSLHTEGEDSSNPISTKDDDVLELDEKSEKIDAVLAEKDSCTCTLTRPWRHRFRDMFRKKRTCDKTCECPVSKPIEKCRKFVVKKLASKT